MKIECFSCDVVDRYVTLANQFTQGLSEVLLGPMWAIFLSVTGLWIVFHGLRVALGRPDFSAFAQEFICFVVAAALLSGQGPELVNLIYRAALSTISGAASAVLTAGGGISQYTGVETKSLGSNASGIAGLDGMAGLIYVAQNGVFRVFQMAENILKQATLTNPSPLIIAVVVIVPYALLLIVYLAQVVVTIFRVMMFAALSPILMMALGFGWGKNIALNGIRTLFAAFMVLYGATIALAICLYGVNALGVADPQTTGDNVRAILQLDNPTLWVAVALGWLGTAFMAEATGMANSIAGSSLTNQAAAVITAGAVGTGVYFLNRANSQWGQAAADVAGTAGKGVAFGAGAAASALLNPGNAADAAASRLSPAAQAIAEKIRR